MVISISLTVVPNERNRQKGTYAESVTSLGTSSATVQQKTPSGTLEAANHVKDMYVVPVEVNYITSRIAQWRINESHTAMGVKEGH